ncbi:MAG: hypothetical protein M1333_02495 [Patescibacteria group bacterium]|nr:hypothetical protein [Patescibacteria group bacterium]
MPETSSNEAVCPHCGAKIYKGFVVINHYCPSCSKPVEAENLLPCQEQAAAAAPK